VDEVTITAGKNGAEVWRWEVAAVSSSPFVKLGRDALTSLGLRGLVGSIDAGNQWLMRCDSVKFPPNGCAFTHTQQWPGVRLLREGTIRIDADGASHYFSSGEAWVESGHKPVFVQAVEQGCSCFVRMMLLPRKLKGKSLIYYVNEDDCDKPKSQRYEGYVDEFIEH
jgi:hypothetical protein